MNYPLLVFIIIIPVQLTLNTSTKKKHSRKIPMKIPNTENIAGLSGMKAAGFTVGIDVRVPERTKHILQKFPRPCRLIDCIWRVYRRITIQRTSWWLIRIVDTSRKVQTSVHFNLKVQSFESVRRIFPLRNDFLNHYYRFDWNSYSSS